MGQTEDVKKIISAIIREDLSSVLHHLTHRTFS